MTSFDLKEPGSFNTSPSRFPKILVEYQPFRPRERALKPGARMVFMRVCPVLKSLPAMATLRSRASSRRAGVSTARFGAPLM